MKRLLLLALSGTTCILSPAKAQPAKGSWMVGANLANASTYIRPNTGNNFNVSVNPAAGYFLTNRLVAGTTVGGSFGAAFKSHFVGYHFTPFTRYYFASKEGIRLHRPTLFAEASAGVAGQRYVDKVNNLRLSDRFFQAGYGAGASYFINPNVSIEAMLKMTHYGGGMRTGGPARTVSPSLNLGFQVYLGGSKKRHRPADKE